MAPKAKPSKRDLKMAPKAKPSKRGLIMASKNSKPQRLLYLLAQKHERNEKGRNHEQRIIKNL